MSDYVIRWANNSDAAAIEVMLTAYALPTIGVATHITQFLVAESTQGAIIGVIGALNDGERSLLRSFAVHASRQKSGVGLALVRRMLAELQRKNYKVVYLLTETAAAYFQKCGFSVIDREAMPLALLAESGLDKVCPQSSLCMKYGL